MACAPWLVAPRPFLFNFVALVDMSVTPPTTDLFAPRAYGNLLVRGALAIACLLLILSALFAQLNMQGVANTRTVEHGANTKMPSAVSLSALFLNYNTLAADLAWIKMVVDYGDKISLSRKNRYMLHNGIVISELDPLFRHVYDWVPGAYMANNLEPTTEQLIELTKLLNWGQLAFPGEGRISYDAAVNFLGYSVNPSDERIVRESEIAISLLERAMKLPGTPDRAVLLLEWFKRRRATVIERRLDGIFFRVVKWMPTYKPTLHEPPNLDLLAQFILSTDDPDVRERLIGQLHTEGNSAEHEDLIRRVEQLSGEYEDRHKSDWRSFVPASEWGVLYAGS